MPRQWIPLSETPRPAIVVIKNMPGLGEGVLLPAPLVESLFPTQDVQVAFNIGGRVSLVTFKGSQAAEVRGIPAILPR